MSENVTFETIVDEIPEIQDDDDDFEDYQQSIREHLNLVTIFFRCYYPFLIVIGVPCNILALLILIRRRLWIHHEAYIYLAAVLIINVTALVVRYGDHCIAILHFDRQLIRLSISADIICKLWGWILHFYYYSNWLHVLMLLNVYLRQQLATSNERRGCYTNLSAKYCTLFGTKVVICSFLTVYTAAYFWSFSGFSLQSNNGMWRCGSGPLDYIRHRVLYYSLPFTDVISLVIVLSLILLAVWKTWKRVGFSQMNGATGDNGDAQVTARIVVFCSAVVFALKIPTFFIILHSFFQFGFRINKTIHKVFFAIHVIALASPLSTPNVCFALKSTFRDEMRAIIDRCCYRCCPRARCNCRTLPTEADSDRNSILQMGPIEEDVPVTSREEEFAENRNEIQA